MSLELNIFALRMLWQHVQRLGHEVLNNGKHVSICFLLESLLHKTKYLFSECTIRLLFVTYTDSYVSGHTKAAFTNIRTEALVTTNQMTGKIVS